jgi:hypothetical protein
MTAGRDGTAPAGRQAVDTHVVEHDIEHLGQITETRAVLGA